MVISAFVCSIAAMSALVVALGQGQSAKEFHTDRLAARYAAEAGIVWAMQKLWANGSTCFHEAGVEDDGEPPIDPDGRTQTPPLQADVVTVDASTGNLCPCPCGATSVAIRARVAY